MTIAVLIESTETEAAAPECFRAESFDLDGRTPITWRGPDVHGLGDSWIVQNFWDQAGHSFAIDVRGSEMGGVLSADDALDLAYSILAVLNGDLANGGDENISFNLTVGRS